MTKFLTLKHWQLIVILFGFPLIILMIEIGYVMAVQDHLPFFLQLPLGSLFFIAFYFGWFYSVGINLYNKLPSTATMNLSRFKIFILFQVVFYMLAIFMFLYLIPKGIGPNFMILIIYYILSFFALYCMFYCHYFNAKILKTVEQQRPVTFGNFAFELLLLWFIPIGFWIIQPRLNKLFETTDKITETP